MTGDGFLPDGDAVLAVRPCRTNVTIILAADGDRPVTGRMGTVAQCDGIDAAGLRFVTGGDGILAARGRIQPEGHGDIAQGARLVAYGHG